TMVNRRISKDLKECALRLWDHGWELEDICEAFGVSRRSCYRWRRIFEEHGAVEKPPSPLIGRTHTITRALLMAIQDLFSEESDLYLDEVCTWLAFEHDIIISPSALSRNLEQAGLT
ncbi:Homeodomain-like protein, partial [Suillus occidentalis]